jgi:hypothetical protein
VIPFPADFDNLLNENPAVFAARLTDFVEVK